MQIPLLNQASTLMQNKMEEIKEEDKEDDNDTRSIPEEEPAVIDFKYE